MFDPCSHKANLYKQGELDRSLSSSNKLNVQTNPLLQCIVCIPKQTQFDQEEFWASTKVGISKISSDNIHDQIGM
jgi:hypothetical protein